MFCVYHIPLCDLLLKCFCKMHFIANTHTSTSNFHQAPSGQGGQDTLYLSPGGVREISAFLGDGNHLTT